MLDFLVRKLGKKFGKCIADGHRMCYVDHGRICLGRFNNEYTACMNFKCSNCGYEDDRPATQKEVDAIMTVRDAEFKI